MYVCTYEQASKQLSDFCEVHLGPSRHHRDFQNFGPRNRAPRLTSQLTVSNNTRARGRGLGVVHLPTWAPTANELAAELAPRRTRRAQVRGTGSCCWDLT